MIYTLLGQTLTHTSADMSPSTGSLLQFGSHIRGPLGPDPPDDMLWRWLYAICLYKGPYKLRGYVAFRRL